MENVNKYNNLVNQAPKHLALIEILFHKGKLREMLSRLSSEKIDFMLLPDEENSFVCVSSSEVIRLSIQGLRLMDKDKIMLFGLTEFLADKDIAFSKEIAKKIKNEELKELAEKIIGQFELFYFIERHKSNGTEIIQF
ncbi:hypothetical protein [Psychromonas ossibalaenae]|uniref:hypothetical protein n=1 Tax=Psychromonas ossibalaenae TaxID=444922 RepID=UPI00037C3ACB|nr:hypothetical protein [Psychromonas ossibalaenae]